MTTLMGRGDRRDDASLEALTELASHQHIYLRRAADEIRSHLTELATRDAPGGVRARAARDTMVDLCAQLRGHLDKEEHLLFPALQLLATAEREGTARPDLPFSTLLYPIRLMEIEHARIESTLDRVRSIVAAPCPPDTQCSAWRRCGAALSELVVLLGEHHRSEDEVLFPLALELEARLP